jgi:type II secretory pathway pseudopilin PulG
MSRNAFAQGTHPQKANGWRNRRRGLTLVELIVVLVLLVFFGLAVGGLARTINDARQRVTEIGETTQIGRLTLQRIANDLASIVPLPVALDTTTAALPPTEGASPTGTATFTFYHEDTPDARFSLDEDILRFTTASNDPRRGDVPQTDLVEVAYFVDTDPQTPEQGLVRAVGTLPRLLPDEPQPEQTPREILSERVVSLNFRFYDADANEWLDTWDRTDMLPALVEITVGVTPFPCDEFFARLQSDQRWLEQVEWFTTTVPLRVRTYPDPSVQTRQVSGGTGANRPSNEPSDTPPSGSPTSGTPTMSPPSPFSFGTPPSPSPSTSPSPSSPPFSGQRPSGQGGTGLR